MPLDDKQIKIFNALRETKSDLTSYDLAEITGISRRLIRNKIKGLRKALTYYDIELLSKPNKGYRILIHDDVKCEKLLGEIDNVQNEEKSIPTNERERTDYLTVQLLLSTDYLKVDDLADELYIGRASVSNNLKVIRKRFEKYNLTIINRPGLGIKLEGDEVDKRLCMSEYFFHNPIEIFSDLKGKGFDIEELKEILGQIKTIIIDFLFEYKIKIYGIAFENLAAHIAIAIYRIRNNNYISIEDEVYDKFKNTEEFGIAKKMLNKIEEKVNIKFPESEIAYIAMHLMGKELIEKDYVIKHDENVFPKNIEDLLHEIMNDVYTKLGLDFRGNKHLYVSLGMHIMPMINRLSFNMIIRNPLHDEIKMNYTAAFEAATIAGLTIYKRTGLSLCEDEISYLALHFEYAIEQSLKTVKNVILVCATGRGTSQLVFYHLKEKLSDVINVVGIIDLYSLKSTDFTDVDFILSTVPISIDVPVPVINIPFFLSDEDIRDIRVKLSGNVTKQLFSNYFTKDLFVKDFAADTKEGVFKELDRMVSRHFHSLPGEFFKSVNEREKIASTEYGNLVAVPHPLQPISNETFVAVIILKKPILWESKQVQLVMLLSLDAREHNLEVLYRTMAKFISDKEAVKKVVDSRDLGILMETMNEYAVK